MYAKAFAKVNLFLDVIDKREDGYHNLKMVMLPLELHDSISISVLPYSTDSYVVCDKVELKATKYNMVNKTLKTMREKYGFKENFTITVHKEIPISAGLGGGSSNAAATMLAINSILKLNESKKNLLDLGITIGADVPFCLTNKPAIVEGIGEIITPIRLHHHWHVLIVMPEKGLSTKAVFEQADKVELKHGDINAVLDALEKGDEQALSRAMFNSLQEVSISMNEQIQPVIDMMHKDGLSCVMMSGSGSSVFAISKNLPKLIKLYAKYDNMGLDVHLTKVLNNHE